MRDASSGSALGEFERIYRGNVSAVTSYFARRCSDPQTVAELPADEIDELADRIDAERGARALLERCAQLSALERAALELVDLDGLTPKEAAAALGVPGVCCASAYRGRGRDSRKEHHGDE